MPWDFLRKAAERSAAVAIVLDRTPADAVETISTHLARMLASRGLKDSPLFIVEEGEVSEMGLLPSSAVIEIRQWLQALADDQEARGAVVQQTLDGAVRTLARRTHTVADAATEQTDAVRRLREDANDAYDRAVAAIGEASADGTLLRGEVLARWQEFVGTGELLKSLETRVGWLRDRVVNAVKGKPQQAERVTVAVESGLETLVLEHAEAAAERAEASWRGTAAGQILLRDAGEDLGRASRDFRRRAERAVRDWQSDVLEMVRTEGADKRSTARFLAFGVNGLSVALMVVVFAHTAGRHRRRGGHRRRLRGAGPEAARGRLRRPGRPVAGRARPASARGLGQRPPRLRAPPLHRPARQPGDLARGARAAARRRPQGRRPALRRDAGAPGVAEPGVGQ